MTRHGQHAGEGSPDPKTGTKRLSLWREPADAGAYGDMARGDAWSSQYANGPTRVEINTYPIQDRDGSYSVEEQTMEWTDDGTNSTRDSADIDYDCPSRVFGNLSDAQAEADRLGAIDWSFAIHGREAER